MLTGADSGADDDNDDSECSIGSDDASVTSEEIMENVNGELALFI